MSRIAIYLCDMVIDASCSTDALNVLRDLSLEQVERRLADLDSERAALSLIRRSLAARERAKRRGRKEQIATEANRG